MKEREGRGGKETEERERRTRVHIQPDCFTNYLTLPLPFPVPLPPSYETHKMQIFQGINLGILLVTVSTKERKGGEPKASHHQKKNFRDELSGDG